MTYPLYKIVDCDEIQQGDIIEGCPVLIIPSEINLEPSSLATLPLEIPFECRDVIVISQTCDMFKGREKLKEEQRNISAFWAASMRNCSASTRTVISS